MPSTHSNILLHAVFSTQNRYPLIRESWQDELFAYLGGIVKDHKSVLLKAGGVEDHVHLLLRAHPTVAISETMRLIKANSSKWINEQRKVDAKFRWQKGFGVFSVSHCLKPRLITYLEKQREHHERQSYQEEYFQTLRAHESQFDPRYVFDEEIAG